VAKANGGLHMNHTINTHHGFAEVCELIRHKT